MAKSKFDQFDDECDIVDHGDYSKGGMPWLLYVSIKYRGEVYRVTYELGWDDWYNRLTVKVKSCPDKLARRYTKRVIADHIYLFEA